MRPQGREIVAAARVVGLGIARLVLLAVLVAGLVLARGGSPLAGTLAAAGAALVYAAIERRRPGGTVWLSYIGLFLLFAYLRQLADDVGAAPRSGYVVDLDSALPGGAVPTVWLQDHALDPTRVAPWDVAAAAVHASYFVVPHAVAFLLWRRGSRLFRRYCLALLASAYAGLVVCVVAPTTPPWLAAQDGLLPPVSHVIPELWGRLYGDAYAGGTAVVGPNPVAAMPSLHTAGAVLVALVLWRLAQGRRARWLLRAGAVAYPLAMGLALVYTGEHYVVDVVAGAVAAVAAWTWAPAAAARLAAVRMRRSDPWPDGQPQLAAPE